MYNQAARTYQRTAQTTVSPRELEAGLLLKAAAKLQAVKDGWSERQGELDGALMYNRKLWTVLVTSVTRPENPLPRELKQNIANLGIFIFNRTIELQLTPQPEKLTALVGINRNLAEGLRTRG